MSFTSPLIDLEKASVSSDSAGDARRLVSVIIPAYNAEKFIVETLQSVLGQTHADLEVVVVDDGSTDQTVALIEQMQSRDKRITLYQQKNAGAAVARNLGIQKSHGEFLAFLDADDLWHPTKIEKQYELLSKSPPDVGLVYAYSRMIDVEGIVRSMTGACTPVQGNAFNRLLIDNFVGNGSVAMVRRSALPTPYPFDPKQKGNEDTYFHLRVAANAKVDVVPEFLIGYRWNTSQNMSSNMARQIKSHRDMSRRLRINYPQTPKILLKWSKAGFHLSHAQTLFKKKKYKEALSFFGRVFKTPTYFVSPLFRRFVFLTIRWVFRKVTGVKPPNRPFYEMSTR